MAWSNRWLALALLVCTYGCATRGVVRLEPEGRAPLVYRPPGDARVVAVGQREFLDTLARLTLNEQLLLSLEEFGRTPVLARVDGDWRWEHDSGIGRHETRWGRLALLGAPSPTDATARFTLTGTGLHLNDRERQNLALSYALEAVWDGVAQAVRAAVDPVALRAMVSSALCAYMMLVVLPEPVTKFIAIALTAYLVAYVGLGPVWTMVESYKQLQEACARATSISELEDAGHRFGRALGDNGARVLVMVALAAAGGHAGMSARGPTLPGYARAAVAAEANAGFRLAAVAQGAVRSVTVRPGALVVGVAPAAVATLAWAQGGTSPNRTRSPHRSKPHLDDGNLREGWRHIEARHITGNHPNGPGDLFAPGTTRAQLLKAAEDIIQNGNRISAPADRIQTFQMKTKINGQTDLVRVVVDADDANRIITMFPVRGG